jgi:hypothetical protein
MASRRGASEANGERLGETGSASEGPGKGNHGRSNYGRYPMVTLSVHNLSPLAALVAGSLILIVPRLLNLVVAVYLIAIGLIGVLGH